MCGHFISNLVVALSFVNKILACIFLTKSCDSGAFSFLLHLLFSAQFSPFNKAHVPLKNIPFFSELLPPLLYWSIFNGLRCRDFFPAYKIEFKWPNTVVGLFLILDPFHYPSDVDAHCKVVIR